MFTLERFHKRERGYSGRTMAYTPAENFPELLESMKRAAAALRDAGVPYMLGGGLAAWARGGPPTDHDVDFGNPAMKIPVFGSGQRSLTFSAAGSFAYFCTLHAGMTGTVVVR